MIQNGSEEERDKALKYFFTDPKLEHTIIQKIIRKGGKSYDAEDAYQEGFKIFYRHLVEGTFQGRSSLKTFFIGICIRCWLDGLQKSFYKRTSLTDEQPLLDEEYHHTPEVDLFSKERKSMLREILSLLGERCKDVILMGAQGYSSQEIAASLNLSNDLSVRKIRYRCMNKLKETMQKKPQLMEILKSLNYG